MGCIEKKIYLEEECVHIHHGDLECILCPGDGMNIYGIWYQGKSLIILDEERKKNGATYGIPILFPTPNRIKQGRFFWNEKQIEAKMHGFGRNLAFQITEMETTDMETRLCAGAFIQRDESKFPFSCYLEIEIILRNAQLTYRYKIENKGEESLPYGFALHPFFSNEWKKSTIQINAKQIMKMTEEQLPTGKLEENPLFGKILNIKDLSLDHVFTHLSQPPVIFTTQGVEVTIKGDSHFSHLVVYTPANQNFFCVEPQTCSTDAHNLYAQGYVKESGLLIVPPKESDLGEVNFFFQNIEDTIQ